MQADGILMEATETNFDQVDKKKKIECLLNKIGLDYGI